MVIQYPAFNGRMSNLSAAALIPQLERIEERVERFYRNDQLLVINIGQSPHLRIPRFHEKVRPLCVSIQFYIKDLSLDQIQNFQTRMEAKGQKLSIFGLTGKNARCSGTGRSSRMMEARRPVSCL